MISRNLYRGLLRPLLFRIDPEHAHNLTLRACELGAKVPGLTRLVRDRCGFDDPGLHQEVGGIKLANPLGLAAGFDKNGHTIGFTGSLGFGHVEIGSISAYPSLGNVRPRLFRVPADRAIIVCYGVPNEGAVAVAARLARSRCPVPLGINLVKTNDAARPNTDEEVLADYTAAFAQLQPFASYINLNMSCPNSASDRDFFDDPARIQALLARIARIEPRVPVFMKLKPVRDPGVLREIVRIADGFSFISGFGINLPAGKPAELEFSSPREGWGKLPGAVAGRPVERLINANLKLLFETVGPGSGYRLMAAGGVFSAADAYRKIRLGASVVQLYSAMVYDGPGVVKPILQDLVRLLHRDGFTNIAQAVGADLTGAGRSAARG